MQEDGKVNNNQRSLTECESVIEQNGTRYRNMTQEQSRSISSNTFNSSPVKDRATIRL